MVSGIIEFEHKARTIKLVPLAFMLAGAYFLSQGNALFGWGVMLIVLGAYILLEEE